MNARSFLRWAWAAVRGQRCGVESDYLNEAVPRASAICYRFAGHPGIHEARVGFAVQEVTVEDIRREMITIAEAARSSPSYIGVCDRAAREVYPTVRADVEAPSALAQQFGVSMAELELPRTRAKNAAVRQRLDELAADIHSSAREVYPIEQELVLNAHVGRSYPRPALPA